MNAILQGRSILIVEDEPLIAMEIVRAFESAGARVLKTSTLREALVVVEDDDLSAAVLDHGLSDGDSSKLCERLKELGIPFVLLGTAATVIASQALISGVFSSVYQAIRFGYAAIIHDRPPAYAFRPLIAASYASSEVVSGRAAAMGLTTCSLAPNRRARSSSICSR